MGLRRARAVNARSLPTNMSRSDLVHSFFLASSRLSASGTRSWLRGNIRFKVLLTFTLSASGMTSWVPGISKR